MQIVDILDTIVAMSHNLPNVLREKGLKATPARLAILNVFSADCKPINAEYIQQRLKGKDINLVTIYRTLSSLETSGILKTVDLRKGSAYYEFPTHHHHHIVCTSCGKTESFEMCEVDKVSKSVLQKSPLFKTINQHSLELFGVCKSCSKD